jgi:cytochrome c biogenesis protein CcmG, thiol:disulfide interchange protein DsbE
MRRPLWILGALALVAVLAVGIVQAGGDTPDEQAAGPAPTLDRAREQLAGAPAPLAALHEDANVIRAATVADLERQLEQLKGYPVVVNAWASWCGPCKLEFPIFQRAATRLGKEVAFVGLNVQDNREEAEAFLRSKPVPYPHLEDGEGDLARETGASGGLPATVFYDADGERASIHQGQYRTEQELLDDIRRHTGAGA